MADNHIKRCFLQNVPCDAACKAYAERSGECRILSALHAITTEIKAGNAWTRNSKEPPKPT